MAQNAKYFYMKLKEDFFDSPNLVILEAMPDGYLYSNILLKLYLKSLASGGKLLLNGMIPYTANMLAAVTRHKVGVVEKAVEVFGQMGLIEKVENGTIYMLDIQQFIGNGSSEAERKAAYRKQIEAEKCGQLPAGPGKSRERGQTKRTRQGQSAGQVWDNVPEMSRQSPGQCPPEIELKLELEKEINITPIIPAKTKETTEPTDQTTNGSREDGVPLNTGARRSRKKAEEKVQYAEFVKLREKEYQSLIDLVGESGAKRCVELLDNYKGSSGKSYKDDYRAIHNWVLGRYHEEQAKGWPGKAPQLKRLDLE